VLFRSNIGRLAEWLGPESSGQNQFRPSAHGGYGLQRQRFEPSPDGYRDELTRPYAIGASNPQRIRQSYFEILVG